MPRIIKEPQERKQEILDTAMELFYQNGYENTSIADIAKKLCISQGLCYRYFISKEELFDCAVSHYAQQIVNKMVPVLCNKNLKLKEKLLNFPSSLELEEDKNLDKNFYYKVIHTTKNKKIHDQLMLKVCELVTPVVSDQFHVAQDNGEIKFLDIDTAASFCVYGQLGILMNEKIRSNQKSDLIRNFLNYILNI